MYTERDLKDYEHNYTVCINVWNTNKRAWLNSIYWLKENKKHLPLKQYNELKHLTKQTRKAQQQAIEISFQKKIKAHNKLREVEKYLASKQYNHDNDVFMDVLAILDNMTQEQRTVFMKRKHEINIK